MMKKRCRNCGMIVRAEAVYCPGCGKSDLILYDPDAQGDQGNEHQEFRTISLKHGEETDSGQNDQEMKTVYHQPDAQVDRAYSKQAEQEKLNWPKEENAAKINLQYDEKISHMKRARKALAIALLAVAIVLIFFCSIVYGKSVLIKFGLYSLKGGTVRIYSYYSSDTGPYRVDVEGDELVIYYDYGNNTVWNYEFVSDRFLLLKSESKIYMCNYTSKLLSGKLIMLDILGSINLEYLGNWSLVYMDDDTEPRATWTIDLYKNGSMFDSDSSINPGNYYCWTSDYEGQKLLIMRTNGINGFTRLGYHIIQIDEDSRIIYYQY